MNNGPSTIECLLFFSLLVINHAKCTYSIVAAVGVMEGARRDNWMPETYHPNGSTRFNYRRNTRTSSTASAAAPTVCTSFLFLFFTCPLFSFLLFVVYYIWNTAVQARVNNGWLPVPECNLDYGPSSALPLQSNHVYDGELKESYSILNKKVYLTYFNFILSFA